MTSPYQSITIDNMLYSCSSQMQRSIEKFLDVHALIYVLEGELHLTTSAGTTILKAGTIGLLKRNQLVRSIKMPPLGGEFKSINIFLAMDILRKYSADLNDEQVEHQAKKCFYELPNDIFVKAFFESLQPYFDNPERMSPLMTELKTREAIELLLNIHPDLKEVLFDFADPHKIDLEAFMLQNFMFNVPIDTFGKLTGRSRAGFKRDFEKVFSTTPGQWLKQKRLQEAYHLIKDKGIKPSAAYLEVGFENLSHFSFAFKQAYGVNPSAV